MKAIIEKIVLNKKNDKVQRLLQNNILLIIID